MKRFFIGLLVLILSGVGIYWLMTDKPDDKSPHKNIELPAPKVQKKVLKQQSKLANDDDNAIKKSLTINDIENYWSENSELSAMESLFLNQEQALDFINIYQQRADDGEPLAAYLVSLAKLHCGLIQDFDPNKTAVSKQKLGMDLRSYCDSYLKENGGALNTEELHVQLSLAQQELLLTGQGKVLEDAFGLMELTREGITNTETYDAAIDKLTENHQEFYEKVNKSNKLEGFLSDSNGKLSHGVKHMAEEAAHVDSAAKISAIWNKLSNFSVSNEPHIKNEIAAWLVALCSSGYSCDGNQNVSNGLQIFCNFGFECNREKQPLDKVIRGYVGDEAYQGVLMRSMQISTDVINGNQQQLRCGFLSGLIGKNVCES